MTTKNRTIRFELHILPLFRLTDRDHMKSWFDLFDPTTFYDDDGSPKLEFIIALAKHLTGELTPQMPPANAGGPWPEEWIHLYYRWVEQGCPRLEVATGEYRAMRLGQSEVKLSAKAEVPTEDHEVWLQRQNTGPQDWSYVLFTELESESSPDVVSTKFISEQINDIPTSVTTLTIRDRQGTHVVGIEWDGSLLVENSVEAES